MKPCFLLLILLIPLTSAIQFSPTSLEFNLEKNKVSCQKISLVVETNIAEVHDSWAKNFADAWTVSNFKTSSQELGIQMNYPSEINSAQKELQVCLTASKPGSYKGALIFRQEKVGNSIIQFAVWLKVSVSGEASNETSEKSPSKNETSSKSSKSSGRSINRNELSQETLQSPASNFQNLGFPIPDKKIKLKNPIQEKSSLQKQTTLLILIFMSLIFVIALLFILIKSKKPNKE